MAEISLFRSNTYKVTIYLLPRVFLTSQNDRIINRQITSSIPSQEHSDSDFPLVSIRISNLQVTGSTPS